MHVTEPIRPAMTILLTGLILIGLVVFYQPVFGQTPEATQQVENELRVQVQSADPEWEGRSVRVSVLSHAMGMEEEAQTVLGPADRTAGETVELGTLAMSPGESLDLVVETEQGIFLQPISPSELQQGTVVTNVGNQQEGVEPSIENHFAIVQPFPSRVMVREMVFLRNDADGPLPSGIAEFTLPPGVEEVRPGQGFRDEADLRVEENRLSYRLQVGPGITVLEWFYMIPAGNTYDFERTATYPTAELQVQVPRMEGIELNHENLDLDDSDQRLYVYERRNLSPGDRYRITLSGLEDMELPAFGEADQPADPDDAPPGPVQPGTDAPDEPWHPGAQTEPVTERNWPVILGILFSILVFAGSYAYVRYFVTRQEPAVDPNFIIEEIARLDQAAEQDRIPEEYYEATRKRWKSAVRESDPSTG